MPSDICNKKNLNWYGQHKLEKMKSFHFVSNPKSSIGK